MYMVYASYVVLEFASGSPAYLPDPTFFESKAEAEEAKAELEKDFAYIMFDILEIE